MPDELLHSGLFGHMRGALTGAISDRLGRFAAADGSTVSEALLRHRWDHFQAARELGISRVGLANKIRRYNLNRITAH